MGEVYLAHDPRLDRRVAIKVLPADTAADPRSRERLRREGHRDRCDRSPLHLQDLRPKRWRGVASSSTPASSFQ
jgi:serine/threonine protein kinase